MADAPVLPDTEDGVAVRTFNRPERLNASAAALSRRFGEGRRELQRSPDVRARVVTGAGRAFCAGYDLHYLPDFDTENAHMTVQREAADEPGTWMLPNLQAPTGRPSTAPPWASARNAPPCATCARGKQAADRPGPHARPGRAPG